MSEKAIRALLGGNPVFRDLPPREVNVLIVLVIVLLGLGLRG